MKRTIEMEDTLESRVNSAIEQVREHFQSYLKDNNCTECPDVSDLNYSGEVHEIVDSCVPVYTKEIKDTWYLHQDELTEAYENSGMGDNSFDNGGMVAIYCYIEQKVYEWFDENSEEIFENFKKDQG
jgi:hypothetical protein